MLPLQNQYLEPLLNGSGKRVMAGEICLIGDIKLIQTFALELLSTCLTAIRGFSHSKMSVREPLLHRSIVFAMTDLLENIPSHLNDDVALRGYLTHFVSFTRELDALLVTKGCRNSEEVLPLFALFSIDRDYPGLIKST